MSRPEPRCQINAQHVGRDPVVCPVVDLTVGQTGNAGQFAARHGFGPGRSLLCQQLPETLVGPALIGEAEPEQRALEVVQRLHRFQIDIPAAAFERDIRPPVLAGGTGLQEALDLCRFVGSDRLEREREPIVDVTESDSEITHTEGWDGDIRHSEADVTAAQTELGYELTVSLHDGLEQTVDWLHEQ